MTKATTVSIPTIFDRAFDNQAELFALLGEHGITTKEEAKPHAIKWAEGRFNVQAHEGQRGGMTFEKDTPAYNAVKYVLRVIFEQPKTGGVRAKTDAVAVLLEKFNALSASEQRRFLKALG